MRLTDFDTTPCLIQAEEELLGREEKRRYQTSRKSLNLNMDSSYSPLPPPSPPPTPPALL